MLQKNSWCFSFFHLGYFQRSDSKHFENISIFCLNFIFVTATFLILNNLTERFIFILMWCWYLFHKFKAFAYCIFDDFFSIFQYYFCCFFAIFKKTFCTIISALTQIFQCVDEKRFLILIKFLINLWILIILLKMIDRRDIDTWCHNRHW